MTHHSDPRNALEAVLAAGRPASSSNAAVAPASRDGPLPVPRLARAIDHSALLLLARVLAYRPAQGPPVVQIAGCGAGQSSDSVAARLAHACAVLVGRTLLLEIERPRSGLFAAAWPERPLPDVFLPGLYHYRLGPDAADLLYGEAREQVFAQLSGPFRIVILRAPGPHAGATLALARMCCCTVLVVEPGRTRLAAVKTAMGAYSGAGGRVIGTVLAGTGDTRRTH